VVHQALADGSAAELADFHGAWWRITDLAVRPLGSVVQRQFAASALHDEAAVHARHLTDGRLHAPVAGRSIDNMAARVAASPQADALLVALLFAVNPVNHVGEVGGLIERIDDLADFLHFGGDGLARLAARQRFDRDKAAFA